jgi:hypothetical protein
VKCIYRLSDNSYAKVKLEGATKVRCLMNFLEHFPQDEVTVLVDAVKPETREWLETQRDVTGLDVQFIEGGSSAQSFRIGLEYALNLPNDESVYFVEDDYWHLEGSRIVLEEGLKVADYVTLYDHKDKYIPASKGGNPFIDESGGEVTRVILTQSAHWKLTNSTTCTFATNVATLRQDMDVWRKWCFAQPTQTHPNDFQAFLELRDRGRSLISPIPGFSTHCEPDWKSPLIDWTEEMNGR